MDMSLSKLRELVMNREALHASVHGLKRVEHDWATEMNWTELDCKEIKPVNPKRNQLWILIERTDAEAETLILWTRDGKSQLIRKDPDVGKDWRQEEKGMTEDEMVGLHHRLDGHEFE